MVQSFPKTLAYLRREKKISQKEAASSLGISQALLSHYENGLREPGLEFAVRAAEYYGVTTDYLLGVSADKSGKRIALSELPEAGTGKKSRGENEQTEMQKKLSLNSLSFLYETVGRLGSKALLDETAAYIGLAVYKLYRYLASEGEVKNSFFLLSPQEYEPLCDAELKRTEGNIKKLLREKGGKDGKIEKLPTMDMEYLHESFPAYEQSVLALLHAVGERLEKIRRL